MKAMQGGAVVGIARVRGLWCGLTGNADNLDSPAGPASAGN